MSSLLARISDCRKIQSGGEAIVYRAKLDDSALVVVKLYKESSLLNISEASDFYSHKFPNVPEIFDVNYYKKRPYIISEYIQGISSLELSPMPALFAVRLLRNVVISVSALYSKGLFHGDISPDNILIKNSSCSYLIDCGIKCMGTPHFAAPERFHGVQASMKSELFSLGAVLFFWLSCEYLCGGSSFDAIERSVAQIDSLNATLLLHGKGRLNIKALNALDPLWKGLLKVKPEDRFEDFEELDERLEIVEKNLVTDQTAEELEECELWKAELKARIQELNNRIDSEAEEFPLGKISGTNRFVSSTTSLKFILCLVSLIIIIIGLVIIFFINDKFQVEDVAKSMLESSRHLQMDDYPRPVNSQKSSGIVTGIVVDEDSLSGDLGKKETK